MEAHFRPETESRLREVAVKTGRAPNDLIETAVAVYLQDGAPVAKTAPGAEEFLLWTTLLPAIRERYGPGFRLLEIPEVLRSDRNSRLVCFRHYVGRTYNDSWNEMNGGEALGLDLSLEMVQIISDLQTIDVDSLLSEYPVGQWVRRSSFDLQGWLASFRERRAGGLTMGLTADEIDQAEEVVKSGFKVERQIMSNGDFYPRNLVKMSDRIVLLDWAHWAGYRACFVDHVANVAAFAFVHMWGNPLWQRKFVGYIAETLDIGSEDLRRAVLIKSFEQGNYWLNNPQLVAQVAAQVNHFRMALRNQISS
jgi:hypothetical protein